VTTIDLACADDALDWLRHIELILPVRTQAALDAVADAYEHLRKAVSRLLDACDAADAAVTQDNYSDRRALPTGLIRRLLSHDEEASDD
jgi:hypothetical protein